MDKKITNNEKKKRLVLIDAHAILHRAYHALPDFSTKKGEPTGALYGLSAMLIKIIEDLKPDYLVACYDVKGPTYRHEAYVDYKAGRKKAEDDLIAQIIRSRDVFTALNVPIYDKQGFEADDILGTIVNQIREPSSFNNLEIIIASGDMDTMQLISGRDVKVYTLKKGIRDTIMYDEDAVKERFGFGPELITDYKGLRGDPSDNIPGVKGIGEKTATILIQKFGTIENLYLELENGNMDKFKEAGITPRIVKLLQDSKEEAEFSKMLATIRPDVPITFVLPEKTFKESVDMKKVIALWRELEFRTLSQRLEKVLGITNPTDKSGDHDLNPTNKDGAHDSNTGQEGFPIGTDASHGVVVVNDRGGNKDATTFNRNETSTNNEDLQKTAIALWLVDSNLTNPTKEDILNFANDDDYNSSKEIIFAELEKRGLRKVYEEIELPLIPIIREMKERGVKINRELLKDLSEKYTATLHILEKKIWQEAGQEFNINSPKQLGEILFDKLGLEVKNQKKTAGGARSTRESELEKMRDMHPIVPFIFEYRELQKLLSTYIDAIPPLLDGGNRLHAEFIQSGTTTGRLASQDPNLQNIPIRSEHGKVIREAFVAEKGFSFCGFDYSQIELRIAAFLSGDEKLIEIFKNGEDVHSSVASRVFNVPINEVTSEMRRRAKVINFGIIYGMGVLALKQNLGTSREEAQQFYNNYFATFSGLASYLDRTKEEANRKGFTETFFGRRRYFEGLKSKIPYVKAQAERMAINAPIQGTEADIIKLAMIQIHEYIAKENLQKDVFLLLQVHDELIYEVREGLEDKVSNKIKEIMESIVNPEKIRGIVLRAEGSRGKNWGELK